MEPFDEGALFPTTRWNTVKRAQEPQSKAAAKALDTLCATYWKPISGYMRYLGVPEQDVSDLTQEFFHRLVVERNLFLKVRQESGKLRTFVCVAVKRMVIDDIRKKRRQKRGGGATDQPLEEIENSYAPASQNTPDKEFDMQWARALIDRTLTELESDYYARGKHDLFMELRPFLSSDGDLPSQQEIADRLQIGVSNVGTSLERLRRRYGTMFRKQVATTVPGGLAEEVDSEIVYLTGLL